MDNTNKYFKLVETKIIKLEEELKEIEKKEDNKSKLKSRFLIERINYLKKLKDLPLYLAISKMPSSVLDELKKETVSENPKDYFIKLFDLENIDNLMSKPKIETLAYLKEAFLDDFDSLYNLISMQKINSYCKKRIADLYNGTESSVMVLKAKENRTQKNLEELNEINKYIRENYDRKTLKEIRYYINNKNENLSIDFILKHKDKINKQNPLMNKTIDKLTKKHSFIYKKLFSKKTKKLENEFLESVTNYYKNDAKIKSLGITEENIYNASNSKINKFLKTVNKEFIKRQNNYIIMQNELNSKKSASLKEIGYLRNLQTKTREEFNTLIHSKSKFITKNTEEQLWNETSLTESLIKVACYKEESNLVSVLSTSLNQVNTLNILENKEIEEEKHIKKLVA